MWNCKTPAEVSRKSLPASDTATFACLLGTLRRGSVVRPLRRAEEDCKSDRGKPAVTQSARNELEGESKPNLTDTLLGLLKVTRVVLRTEEVRVGQAGAEQTRGDEA